MKKNNYSQLKREIENSFGHLAEDEIAILASNYEESTTRAIAIVDVRVKSAKAMDLKKDIEFSHVIFPKNIMPLLDRNDIFFATIGLEKKKWHVLYMSPPYDVNA